ncbi:MAG: LLM class flavin-dependent oxidoreductase [Nitrososphaerales archaeon]
MQLPKKSGIALRCQGNPSNLLDCTHSAERVGFDSLWLVEVAEADVLALAGAISEVTSEIKIATGVVNSNLRLPTLLAMGCATLSELSNGRFALGVGAGDAPMSYTVEIPENTALTRLRETLEIVHLCLSSKNVEYRGKLFEVKEFKLGFKLQNKVPIFGAAMGTKMVKIVVEVADGVLLMMPTPDYMKRIKQTIDSVTSERLTKKSPSVACHLVTSVSESRAEAEETAKRAVVSYIKVPVYRNSFVRMGFGNEISALELESNKQRPNVKLWERVPTGMAEKLIVYGTPEECVQKINTFVSQGVEYPIIYPCMTRSGFPDNVNDTIRLLAPFLEPREGSGTK